VVDRLGEPLEHFVLLALIAPDFAHPRPFRRTVARTTP
jgi:hypothetical protein